MIPHAHRPTERMSLREAGGGLLLFALMLLIVVLGLTSGPVPS